MQDKYIFRRETPQPEPGRKKPAEHKRKDMTPFISLFNEREQSRFVRKIFRNDLAHFNIFMQQLNTKMTWQEVFQSIESEMKVRKVEMDRDEVRQMTDRIYQIFFPDDISIGA